MPLDVGATFASTSMLRSLFGFRSVEHGDENDLAKRRGRYDCTAVQRDVVRDGELVGRFGAEGAERVGDGYAAPEDRPS